jgi:hypothetical protein
MPPATIATPTDIGGQVTEENVLVYHTTGPYAGMTLVNHKDDPTLAEAEDAGEIEIFDGSPLEPPTESTSVDVDIMLTGLDDEEMVNPPEAYPTEYKLVVNYALEPSVPPTVADVTITYLESMQDPQPLSLVLSEESDLDYSTVIPISGPGPVRIDVMVAGAKPASLNLAFEPVPESGGGAETEAGGEQTDAGTGGDTQGG